MPAIIVDIGRAISAAYGVTIIVGLARVSWDGVFLVWNWVVLVFSYVLFSSLIDVSVLVKSVAGSPVGCCSAWCCLATRHRKCL